MFKYIMMHLKSQMEYKSSIILSAISQFLTFLMYCTVFYSLFEKFGILKDFNIYQVILCFSVVQFGESFSEAILRGFDKFSDVIKNGKFDLLLIRPQNIYLQVMGTKVEFAKLFKSTFSLVLLVYAGIKLKIYMSITNMLIILLMLAGSVVVFSSVFIIGAALCFKTIEGLEVINIFVYGTRDFAQYPIGIYNKVVKTFFTYIVPIGIASYFPMLYITGVSTNILYALLPILSIITLIPACCLFNLGVKNYKSTGS